MTDEPEKADAEKIADLEKQVVDLKAQLAMANAQVQAAINQRNFHANEAVSLSAQLMVKQ